MKNFLKKGKFLFLLPCLVSLTSCDGMQEAFNGVEDKLWPNVWVALSQFLAFCVMALIVYFFAFKPIKRNLDARRDHVAKTVKDAEVKLENAKIMQDQADQNLKESHQEGAKIIDEAHKVAETDALKLKSQNEVELSLRKEQVEKDLANAKKKMEQEIHNEIIKGALEASKEILQRELTNNDNNKIVEDFIKEAGKDKK
jgi:F-type H+-transporting ATPase subunit b